MVEYEIQKGRPPVKFIAGLVLGLSSSLLVIYMYLTSSSAPVATTDSDMPFEDFLPHKCLNARIAKDMPKIVPVPSTEANFLAGAELYKQHCGSATACRYRRRRRSRRECIRTRRSCSKARV
jgi:hypothetical protein